MNWSETRLLERKLPPHKPGEVLARLALPQTRLNLPVEVMERFELSPRRGAEGDLLRLKLPQGMTTAQGIAWLEKDPRFEYVTSNDVRQTQRNSDDYSAESLWGLDKIQAPQAWEQTVGSRQTPIIAVLDTGVDLDHPDLQANLWTNAGEIPGNGLDDDGNGVIDDVSGYNAVRQTGDPHDDYGHGSHCAGTIAATGDNSQGVVGVNWQARIMPVKMMENGEGSVADTVRALAYATRMGARITSNSYGGEYNEAERDAFENSPLFHVCAAGNEGNDNDVSPYYPHDHPVGYPANYPLDHIMAVGASDRRDRLARFSNYGVKNVDLAAPGVGILSTVPGGGYEEKSGTSMATPHVAGVAGLITSLYPEISNRELRTRLLANVDVLPQLADKVATSGRLNAARALERDDLPPAPVQQLKAESEGPWANLRWLNSGDDGMDGNAYRYHVRWGDEPSQTRSGPARPCGQEQTLRIPIDDPQTTVEVRLEDNVGNLSQPAVVNLQADLKRQALSWNSDGLWQQAEDGSWQDSLHGPYANHADSSLTSDWMNLSQLEEPVLRFDTRHRLESSSDFVYLEAQRQGQEEWTRLQEFTSYREHESHHIDLQAWRDAPVRFRFRLVSDGAKVEDGFRLQLCHLVGRPVSR